ncbi:50S ribosomal protein L44e [Candidatus Woesearchaeota archaeon]|nr:50S ribosomal protein L44e [Candidatus Woesearchaeota archaeon]
MKIPKLIKRYCKHCKTHSEHKVALSKNRTRNTAHPLSQGSMIRMNRRSQARGSGNLGKVSRGALNSWKRYNKKTSKKADLRFTCKVCNKTSPKRNTIRTKKVEFQ